MRILKYLNEAVKKHMIDSFEQWKSDQTEQINEMSDEDLVNSAELNSFLSSRTRQPLETLSQSHKEVVEKIFAYEDSLSNGSLGPTASVWSTFLQMVQILLNFARSIKLGDWKLHLQSTETMDVWVRSSKRHSLPNLLPGNYEKLPETHPAIHHSLRLVIFL